MGEHVPISMSKCQITRGLLEGFNIGYTEEIAIHLFQTVTNNYLLKEEKKNPFCIRRCLLMAVGGKSLYKKMILNLLEAWRLHFYL